MSSTSSPRVQEQPVARIQEQVERVIEDLLASLPKTDQLSAEQRRGIIARYTAVLEGNFIYWMTGAWLAVKSDAARSKIVENLHEEVRDSHPNMMRKFAMAAGALPTTGDTMAVHQSLTDMRLFIGRLSSVRILITMAFFEGLIQRFMPYLAELAQLQGSTEMEYTDVHGVCDVTHTAELYRALEAEMLLGNEAASSAAGVSFEGVELLRMLCENIITGSRAAARSARKSDEAYDARLRPVHVSGNGASGVRAQA